MRDLRIGSTAIGLLTAILLVVSNSLAMTWRVSGRMIMHRCVDMFVIDDPFLGFVALTHCLVFSIPLAFLPFKQATY